jgi:hypothetical protein
MNKYFIFKLILLFLLGCNQKEMIFSAKQIKYSNDYNSIERKLIHEECYKTTSKDLKDLNSLSIESRKKLKSKTIYNLKISRKTELKAIIPTFLNFTAVYEECYKIEGIIKNDPIKN